MHDFSLAFLYLSSTPWNTWITTLLNFKSHKWSIIPSSYITTLFLTILLLTSLSLSLSLGTKLLMEKSPETTEEEALTKKLQELLSESDNEETENFNCQEEKVEEMMQDLYKEKTFSTCHICSTSSMMQRMGAFELKINLRWRGLRLLVPVMAEKEGSSKTYIVWV